MDEQDIIGAYWKQEYEKMLLSKKYFIASEIVGNAMSDPSMDNIKIAYGMIADFIMQIPIPENKENIKSKRKALLDKLDKLSTAIFGDLSNPAVRNELNDMNIEVSLTRKGLRRIYIISNTIKIATYLRDILIEAGEFATTLGLRITIPIETEGGIEKLLKEEGFDNLEV